MPLSGQLSVFTSPRCRDPARLDERPLFIVEDQVPPIRQTPGVGHATRLPVDSAEEDRGVRLAIVVHEHELLAKPVLELPEIAPRPLLDRGYRRRIMIDHAHQLVPRACTQTMTGGAVEARAQPIHRPYHDEV
jgi:hypothetical protein